MAKQHRYRQAIAKRLSQYLFIIFWGIVLILLIILFWSAGLLDLTTIVSVGVTDMAVALILYYFFGQGRRGSEEEMINLMDAVQKFSHLKVYKFSVLKTDFFYVENTTTREYFRAPERIESIVDLGVIKVIACENEKDMRTKLQKNGSRPNEQEATIIQLMPVKHRRKQTGVNSDSVSHT